MKKNLRTPLLAAALAGAMVLGASAATAVQKITADLRPDITVRVDGEKQTLVDKNGNIVYPITYEGSTYLPIRAMGNLMDLEVEWDSKTQTVDLSAKRDTKPEDLTLEKLTARTEEAEGEVKALKPAATYAERARQYALHSETIDEIRDDLNEFAQKVNQQLRDGDLTYKEYNVLSAKLGDLDVRLKDALEDLEAKTVADESDKTTLYQEFTQALDEMETRVKAQEKTVAGLKSASTYEGRVKQYGEVSADLGGLSADLSATATKLNNYLRQGKLSYQEYNDLSGRCGQLDVRVKDAWDDLADKTIDYEETGKTDDKTYTGYDKQISDLSKRVDTLESQSKDFGRNPGNKQGWKEIERKIDGLDDEIDDLEDTIERAYRAGELTSSQYKELDRALDRLDDRLDDLDDWFDD